MSKSGLVANHSQVEIGPQVDMVMPCNFSQTNNKGDWRETEGKPEGRLEGDWRETGGRLALCYNVTCYP